MDVDEFKTTIIYIGKGSDNRKMFHIGEAKYHLDYHVIPNKKSKQIIKVWENTYKANFLPSKKVADTRFCESPRA